MYSVQYREKVLQRDKYGYPTSHYEWSEWRHIYNALSIEAAQDSVEVFGKINRDRQYRYIDVEGRHT